MNRIIALVVICLLFGCPEFHPEAYDKNADLVCAVDGRAICDGEIEIHGLCADRVEVEGRFTFNRTYRGRDIECQVTIETSTDGQP